MPRAKNLDLIAPDDPVITTKPKNSKPVTKVNPKPPIKSSPKPPSKPKKTPPVSKSTSSRDLKFRQKVYQLIQGITKSPLSSFLVRPKVFTFNARDDGEEIILVLRRHWFTNIPWIITGILMIFAPFLLLTFSLWSIFPPDYRLILAIFWYLLTFAVAFENFLSWYFNVFILTEERVIDIDFFNLLDKKMSEAKISMIQDVTSKTSGLTQTLFNYGSVIIQTASELPLIRINKVPNPDLVLQVLQQMRSEEEQEALDGRLK